MKTKESMTKTTIEMQNLWNYPVIKYILYVLFGISTASLTCLLIPSKFANIYTQIGLPIGSFILSQILVWKFAFLENLFQGKKLRYWLITLVLSVFWIRHIYMAILLSAQFMIAIVAIPASSIYLYWFYLKVGYYTKRYIQSLDTIEKRYMIGFGTTLAIVVTIVYNVTTVFTTVQVPKENYEVAVLGQKDTHIVSQIPTDIIESLYGLWNDDVIYTTDSATVLWQDVFLDVNADQNDIRQPLFGIFALPFHIVPKIIATLIPQIPNLYPILLAITQGILISIAFVLLSRMMQLTGMRKTLFLLLLTSVYPTLLFLLNIEQYAMSVFYIIVFIYMAIQKLPDKQLAYIAATGSMLTSGIWFPLLGEPKKWKESIQNIGKTFVLCLAIFLVSARILLVFPNTMEQQTSVIQNFFGRDTYSMVEKLGMYTHFIENTILSGEVMAEKKAAANKTYPYTLDGKLIFITIMIDIIRVVNTTNISMFGIVILLAAICAFIWNRKDRFTQICFAWVLFSFVLLFVIGWGVAENGLILYTFYFSWAIVCLLYKCIESICGKHEKIKNGIYLVALIPMLLINLYGMAQIVQFGMQYFPY